MTLEVKKYQADKVEAVLITEENLSEVCEWSEGNQTEIDAKKKRFAIVLGTGYHARIAFAKPGLYLVREPSGAYRLFKDKPFAKVFTLVEE